MKPTRRAFLGSVGRTGVGCCAVGISSSGASAVSPKEIHSFDDRMAVLVDIPRCIGCRRCEYACQEVAGFDVAPLDSFDDKSVFDCARRPDPRSYTVVNRVDDPHHPEQPAYVKVNCLHCNRPACVSSCLVGALRKEPNGAVTYDPSKCMGCRYCMVACPFQIPAYDYDNPLTPEVRKCSFCFEQVSRRGEIPACVKICPEECLTFGRRGDLIKLGREIISSQPDRYVDHIYGETEAGGTSWLYLSSRPFRELGFLSLGPDVPSDLTEAIQHGVFKFFMPPLALYGLLGLIMRLSRSEREEPQITDQRPDDPTGQQRGGRPSRLSTRKERLRDSSLAAHAD